jgi:hypothetical protein
MEMRRLNRHTLALLYLVMNRYVNRATITHMVPNLIYFRITGIRVIINLNRYQVGATLGNILNVETEPINTTYLTHYQGNVLLSSRNVVRVLLCINKINV